jgi:hypothetical protein
MTEEHEPSDQRRDFSWLNEGLTRNRQKSVLPPEDQPPALTDAQLERVARTVSLRTAGFSPDQVQTIWEILDKPLDLAPDPDNTSL